MIDVLKRLAELDAGNPNVENKMGIVENLLTVSNVDGEVAKINEGIETVEECGGMGMGATMPNHTPASINMSANSGEELSNMLRDIMSLAGVNKDEGSAHRALELEPAHAIDSNADMLSSIKVIDSMNEPTNEFDVDADDQSEEGMYDEQPEEGMYANSPDTEEEIQTHDYNGDTQTDPRPQGLRQRVGDNPMTPARESVESLADRLLSEFHEFINEGKKEPMKKALKDKKPKKKVKESQVSEILGFSAKEKNIKVIKKWMDEPASNVQSPIGGSRLWPDNDRRFHATPAGRAVQTKVEGILDNSGKLFTLVVNYVGNNKQEFAKLDMNDPDFANKFHASINKLIGPVQKLGDKQTPTKPGQYQMPSDWGKKEVDEGILHKGAAWLAKKLSSFAGMKALKPGTYIIPPLERMGGKPISFSIDGKSNVPRLNLSGAERNEFELGRLYKHIAAHIQSGNYEVAPSAMQRDYSQKSMPKTRPSKDEEVDEGLGKALVGVGGALALIMGLGELDERQAKHLMKTEPQLITLAQMRQEAFIQNDDERVEELEYRIKKTLDHIRGTGRPVMGVDGLPVDPRKPVGEADVAVSELTKGAEWNYTTLARKSVGDLADKATKADSREDSNRFMNKALKRQNLVGRVERRLAGGQLKSKTQ